MPINLELAVARGRAATLSLRQSRIRQRAFRIFCFWVLRYRQINSRLHYLRYCFLVWRLSWLLSTIDDPFLRLVVLDQIETVFGPILVSGAFVQSPSHS